MKKWVYAISVVAIIISCTGKNNKAKEQYENDLGQIVMN